MFVLITAALIMLGTVLFGIHLKNKVEASAIEAAALNPGNKNKDDENSVYQIGGTSVGTPKRLSTKKVNGDFFDIENADAMTANAVSKAINEIAIAGYSAVSIPITDDGGNLLYNSAAVYSAARIKPNASENATPDVAFIESVITSSKKAGIISSAVMTCDLSKWKDAEEIGSIFNDASLLFDCAVVKELSDIGLDEIILRGYQSQSESTDEFVLYVPFINAYITALRKSAPDVLIGVSLPPAVYRNIRFAPALESLAQYADILAIDLSSENISLDPNEAFDEISDICSSLIGSFTLYNIRVILDGTSLTMRDNQLDALMVNSINNWQFISGIENTETQG